MRMLLIRHGESQANVVGGMDTSAPGPDLTDKGRAQAVSLVERLAGEAIEAIYASTLVRTQQTARPLAEALGLPVHIRDGLREVRVGELEAKSDPAAVATYRSVYREWVEGNPDRVLPGGGESARQAVARFDAVVREIEATHANGTVAVFTHGSALRLWAVFASDNVTPDFGLAYIDNVSIVAVAGTAQTGRRIIAWDGAVLPTPSRS